MLLLVSGTASLILAYIEYNSAKKSITETVIRQLTGIRVNKSVQIEDYFEEVNNLVYLIGQSRETTEALREFKRDFSYPIDSISTGERLKMDTFYQDFVELLAENLDINPKLEFYFPKDSGSFQLQYHYLANNPNGLHEKYLLHKVDDNHPYHATHARRHAYFNRLKKYLEFEDILLIDVQTGNIVYTVNKAPDFATNLLTGPYQGSNLADLFMEVSKNRDLKTTRLVDFQAYRPRCGEPAAFAATPVFDGAELVGIFACQLSVDKINEVITGNQSWEREGLGKTGEVLLIGPDLRLRSDLRGVFQDINQLAVKLEESGAPPDMTEKMVRQKTSVLVLSIEGITRSNNLNIIGRTGLGEAQGYYENDILVSYGPILANDLQWTIIAKQDSEEAYAALFDFQKKVLVALIITMLVLVLLSLVLANWFTRPFERIILSAQRVLDGKEQEMSYISSKDEFGELAQSFNTMVTTIQEQKTANQEKTDEIERLLLNLLPLPVAERLKQGERHIADTFSNVTILFANLIGFIEKTAELTPDEAAKTLNDLISAFDEATEKHGVEKIKSFGNGYMAVSGLTIPRLDHDKRMLDFAIEMQKIVRLHKLGTEDFHLEIGIHSGEVNAGVVGSKKIIYDVWGPSVSLSYRVMEHDGKKGDQIKVTGKVYESLKDLYEFEEMEGIETKRNGEVKVWRLREE